MLVTFLPAVIVVAYAAHNSYHFWRAPNPYRRSVWLIGLLTMTGVLILLYVPTLADLFPNPFSPAVRLATHQLFNISLMLSGYFANAYYTDIMYGWNTQQAQSRQRQFLAYLLVTIAIMIIFFVRAVQDGEQETPTWFAANPLHNGNLIVVSVVCLIYMCSIYVRIASYSLRFARITPIPSFKTGNHCFVLTCYLGLFISFLAFCCLWIPANSPFASFLELAIFLLIGLLFSVFYVGARLVENPQKRMRRFGERVWSIITVARLYPLWQVMTTKIPEVVPPLTMPWLSAVIQNRVELLRDARIIEILDAVHRLDFSLWSENSHREWLINFQQVVNNPTPRGESLHQQVNEVEHIAQKDAARLVVAIANYLPSASASSLSTHIASPIATISRAPSFSAQEVHYLELVAAAFRRMHYAAAHEPDLVSSRFDVA